MKISYFTHSLLSCWNHGNAHFLRGVLSELIRRGHEVSTYEPAGAWSLDNLLQDAGESGLDAFRQNYPDLHSHSFGAGFDAAQACAGDDLVLVHEWNEPDLVAALGRARKNGARFTLLFHDTHHRAVSDPDAIRAFDLDGYDGVLAFGETLAAVYRRWGWGERVFVWHEAADTRVFHPPPVEGKRNGLVWISNLGDGERSAELEHFLFGPARRLALPLDIYGVRYPDEARDTLRRYQAHYCGWLPNASAPSVFARHRATVHVPRRFYVELLPGIPTIRIFEALACGIPLVSAPWDDSEGLFAVGEDFLMARSGAEMEKMLDALCHDADLRAALVTRGLDTVKARHTCAHRVDELMGVVESLRAPVSTASPADR